MLSKRTNHLTTCPEVFLSTSPHTAPLSLKDPGVLPPQPLCPPGLGKALGRY